MSASTAVAPHPSTGIAGQTTTDRVVSIDVFRGITMAVMIFVNDLHSVHGLSRWTYHMPRDVDAMTYVDMVYPTFLFIVGMALPLAIAQRLKKDASLPRLWQHILLRAFALVVLGLIIANADLVDAARTHLSGSLWGMLALLGGILTWMAYPRTRPSVAWSLRGLGIALLAVMFALFRRAGGHWIDFSYPEILGLIGLTYVSVCLLYVPTRRVAWAPLAWFVALVALNCAFCAHLLVLHVPMYVFPWDNGAMPSIVTAGVVVSGFFLGPNRPSSTGRRIALALGFAAATAVAGLLLRPLGISKIRATPTWALWSIAAASAIFALLYWVCDLRKWTRWAWIFRPAGSNTLLTYLLPDMYVYLASMFGFAWVLEQWNHGASGVLRCVVFTVFILLVSHVLTRLKLRMQL